MHLTLNEGATYPITKKLNYGWMATPDTSDEWDGIWATVDPAQSTTDLWGMTVKDVYWEGKDPAVLIASPANFKEDADHTTGGAALKWALSTGQSSVDAVAGVEPGEYVKFVVKTHYSRALNDSNAYDAKLDVRSTSSNWSVGGFYWQDGDEAVTSYPEKGTDGVAFVSTAFISSWMEANAEPAPTNTTNKTNDTTTNGTDTNTNGTANTTNTTNGTADDGATSVTTYGALLVSAVYATLF